LNSLNASCSIVASLLAEYPSPNRLWEAKRVGQPISKAMHRLDPVTTIFPMRIEMSQPVRREQRRPYVYSDEEMQRILKAALALPSPKAPLRPLSLFTMVVLAYCAGLRVGEIVGLTLGDVNQMGVATLGRQTSTHEFNELGSVGLSSAMA
jgi:integrase/recombinase XerD